MNKLNNLFSNALIRFGMERRIKRGSTLTVLLISVLGGGGFLLLIYASLFYTGSIDATDLTEFGLSAFGIFAFVHFDLVIFLSILSAGAEISGEKQRQTMDLLVCSQLTSREIIIGKLFSSLSYTLLISIAVLPIYAIIFLFGGITPLQILVIYAMIIFFGCVLSAVSLCFSTMFRKSAVAALMTLLFVLVICGGNGIIELLLRLVSFIFSENGLGALFNYDNSYVNIPWVLQFNPVAFIIVVIAELFDESYFVFSTQGLIEYLITLIFTPVFCIFVMIFSIRIAKNKIDPFKGKKNKA